MYAKVVVDVKSSAVDVIYTYIIPEHLKEYIFVGSRVLIDFNLRKILGYVVEVTDYNDYDGKLKEVLEILDFEQELTLEQVALAKQISKDTKCLFISALELMYPSFLKSKYRKFISINDYSKLDADVALLFQGKNKMEINNAIMQFLPKIKKEIDKGNLELNYDIFTYGKRKKRKLYSLNSKTKVDYASLTPKRKKVYDYLSQNTNVELKDICNRVSCTELLVKDLEKTKILAVVEVDILDEYSSRLVHKPKIEYSFVQKEVREKYTKLSNKPFLFWSNDKKFTIDFYIDIITEALLNQKKVMVVTPTILSNIEVFTTIQSLIPLAKVYDFSSLLTNAEYYERYVNVKWQNFDIIVTTKVGITLPITDLGLIIMLEEGNQNYINEASPKFHSREVLKYRAIYHKAKLLLQSNAPSIETYYHYFTNQYYLLNYNVKYNNKTHLVNMRKEFAKNHILISEVLENEMHNTFLQNKIAVLILNKKGYGSYLNCKSCSTVMKCQKCRIPLTYSKEKGQASCPYCDYKTDSIRCTHCGNDSIAIYGYGLERLEEVLKLKYSNKRILKVESDSFTHREHYLEMLLAIEEKNVDIIIGTHILHGLLHDENIGVVATIDAESILNYGDYRSSEMLFQQISSTVNRREVTGIVQGYDLSHYSIYHAMNQEYEAFFEKEMEYRKQLSYPPILELSRIIISGPYKEMYHCANYFKKLYRQVMAEDTDVLGPVYLKQYRGVQLILKYHNFETLSRLIDEVSARFHEAQVEVRFERYPSNFS